MAKEFTRENVTAAMEAAVELKGENFIYTRSADGGCYYGIHNEDGTVTPSCIVGHVIHTLDPDIFEKVAKFESGKGASEVINTLPRYVSELEAIPRDVRAALAQAQAQQDIGNSWGRALNEYRNTLYAFDKDPQGFLNPFDMI